jgi:hypothetical protein
VAVLAAPAGFGKSTLAGQYAGRRPALWCRVDREDRDVAHLMGNLTSAGLRLRPPIGTETRRLWESRRDLERDGRFLTQSPRGPFEVLSSESGWCRLAARHASADVQDFEAAVQPLEALLRETLSGREGSRGSASRAEGSRAVERLRAAAGTYAGDLLPVLPDAGWAQRERDRLRERFHLVLLGLGVLCLRRGEAEEAIGAARRILADDPLHEEACRILLEGLAARKDRAGVLRSYRAFARRSRRELGVPPGPEMIALVRRVLQRPRSGFMDKRPAGTSVWTG